jgi:hypothetical protein
MIEGRTQSQSARVKGKHHPSCAAVCSVLTWLALVDVFTGSATNESGERNDIQAN